LLGQGGFAEVWKAGHTELKRQPPVALKFCLDEELVASLRREIEIVSVLQDHGRDKDIVRLLFVDQKRRIGVIGRPQQASRRDFSHGCDSFAGAGPSPKGRLCRARIESQVLPCVMPLRSFHALAYDGVAYRATLQ